MLAQIQERDAALQAARHGLERRVQERTAELAAVNQSLLVEIEERKRTEEQLRVQATALDAAANTIVITDPNGTIQSVNPAFAALTGYPAEEVLGKNPRLLKSGKQDEAFYRNLWQTISSGQVWSGELTNRRKDGSFYTEEMTITPVRSAQGTITHYIALKQDVSERKRAEEELRFQSVILSTQQEVSMDGILVVDENGVVLSHNHRFVELWGIPAELIAQKADQPLLNFVLNQLADAPSFLQRVTCLYEHRRETSQEEILLKDGRVFDRYSAPMFGSNDRYYGRVWYFRDITGRKRAEEKLKLFRTLIERSSEGILVVDPATGRFLDANESACQALGYTRDELLALTLFDVTVGVSHAVFEASNAKIEAKGHDTLEVLHRRKDGTTYPAEASLSFVMLDRKYVVAIVRDITERKRAQTETRNLHQQLLESSRLAGMAEIATNVLHNVGNALNSVNISTDLIVEGVRKSSASSLARISALLQEHARDLGEFIMHDPNGRHVPAHLARLSEHLLAEQAIITRELESLRRNVEHIKDVVAMQQNYALVGGVKEKTDLIGLVEDSLRLNEDALRRHGVEVIRELEDVPPMIVEKHKILQILVNLVRNAKYACDESGRADRHLTVRLANGDGRLRISVIDDGIGIPPENLTRIFNHGFTTRKGGHGFGLHSSALAAREMGGSLTVQSNGPGQGAAFTLELPCPEPENAHE
ncbi:MAG TPA: PAS domain S-box protein, partial [Candidatus Acidoferrum sp.]|nr:PAS domain S-box protein [Candidatus Acidoferrum sp.]